MTRFTDRVTRDLHQIADRSTPSSTAWDSIRTLIDEQTDQPTMEVIMLSPDRNTEPKRGWTLAAAVAGLALVGGLVFASTRSDDTAPEDTPVATVPAEPAPDAEVDPDPDAVVVPAPDSTTAAAEVQPPTTADELLPCCNSYVFQDVVMATSPSWSGLVGEESWQGTTVFKGQMAGTAAGTWQTWRPRNGTRFGVGEFVFTGTIEGLGSGTLTYVDQWLLVDGIRSTKGATITGGTGDFEGAYGGVDFKKQSSPSTLIVPRPPENGDWGQYSWNITVPPEGSLFTVTAAGTATTAQFLDSDGPNGFSMVQNLEGSLVGSTRGSGQGWGVPEGIGTAESSWEFTGTIDGLGTGTMTYDRIRVETAEGEHWFDVVTGGTGDFAGITGTGQDGPNGSYTYVLTAPVSQ